MSRGVVTEHLIGLIEKQVDDNGLVVWYDPDAAYSEVVKALELPDTTVLRYEEVLSVSAGKSTRGGSWMARNLHV